MVYSVINAIFAKFIYLIT